MPPAAPDPPPLPPLGSAQREPSRSLSPTAQPSSPPPPSRSRLPSLVQGFGFAPPETPAWPPHPPARDSSAEIAGVRPLVPPARPWPPSHLRASLGARASFSGPSPSSVLNEPRPRLPPLTAPSSRRGSAYDPADQPPAPPDRRPSAALPTASHWGAHYMPFPSAAPALSPPSEQWYPAAPSVRRRSYAPSHTPPHAAGAYPYPYPRHARSSLSGPTPDPYLRSGLRDSHLPPPPPRLYDDPPPPVEHPLLDRRASIPWAHMEDLPPGVIPSPAGPPPQRPIVTAPPPPGPPRPFKCTSCGAAFVRNHDLRRHARKHLGKLPFECPECRKPFSRKDALNRHILVKGCAARKRRREFRLDPERRASVDAGSVQEGKEEASPRKALRDGQRHSWAPPNGSPIAQGSSLPEKDAPDYPAAPASGSECRWEDHGAEARKASPPRPPTLPAHRGSLVAFADPWRR